MNDVFTYTDEYGKHEHETSVPGRAYNPNAPITCNPCRTMLDSHMDAWLAKLSKRHSLPDKFWQGFTFDWS